MLIRKGRQWQLYPHKVKYTQHGEEIEQYALPNKEWWKGFAEQWGHTEIIEFTEAELSDEQLTRYEEVKDMPEDFSELYENYILTGDTSDEIELPTNHPFNIIRLRKENIRLKAVNDAVVERADYTDGVITEIITQLYS